MVVIPVFWQSVSSPDAQRIQGASGQHAKWLERRQFDQQQQQFDASLKGHVFVTLRVGMAQQLQVTAKPIEVESPLELNFQLHISKQSTWWTFESLFQPSENSLKVLIQF